MQTQGIACTADLFFARKTSAAIGVFDLAQRRLHTCIAGLFRIILFGPVGPTAGADGHKSGPEQESRPNRRSVHHPSFARERQHRRTVAQGFCEGAGVRMPSTAGSRWLFLPNRTRTT